MALPTTGNVSTFRKLLELCPSNNVRNLYHIILNYIEAEDESDFSAQRRDDTQALMNKYYNEMDSNTKIYEDELDTLEEQLEDMEFRYYMGTKIDEFNIRRVLVEFSRENEVWRRRWYGFINLPWVLILKKMDEEKKVPVFIERHNTQNRHKTMLMNTTFELAYNLTWKVPDQKVEPYPATKSRMNALIRSHHDLLHLAKASARAALHGVPKLTELRKARKWEALSERIRDLELALHRVAVDHRMLPYNLTRDLVRYRRIWFDTNDEEPWDVSKFALLNSTSTRENRIHADIDRLVGESVWLTEIDPVELAALIRKYGEYVVSGKVKFELDDDIDEIPDIDELLASDKPRTKSMTDGLLEAIVALCVGQQRRNSSLSPSSTDRRRSSGQSSNSRPESAHRRSSGQPFISATESTSIWSSGQSSISIMSRSSGYSAISVIEEDEYTPSRDMRVFSWKSIIGS